MKIETLDHLVLTVKDIDATAAFYQEALGMEKVIFRDNRTALHFANKKINFHQQGNELEPKTKKPPHTKKKKQYKNCLQWGMRFLNSKKD